MGEIKSHEVAGVFNSYLKHIRQKLLFLRQPNKTLPVCYCLYSFEGALCNKHWNEIGEEKRKSSKKILELNLVSSRKLCIIKSYAY